MVISDCYPVRFSSKTILPHTYSDCPHHFQIRKENRTKEKKTYLLGDGSFRISVASSTNTSSHPNGIG
jgi:hypothetical protein